jgi:hypothetical protein
MKVYEKTRTRTWEVRLNDKTFTVADFYVHRIDAIL